MSNTTTTTTTTKAPALSVRTFGTYRQAINDGDAFTPADDGCGIEITFADGSDPILMTSYNLANEVFWQALAHGLKQKLVDAAAISRNPETGRSATVGDKAKAVHEVYNRLLSGEWNKRRESGEGGGTGGLLFAALVRLYAGRKSDDEIRAFLAGKTDKEQAALRASSRVAPIIQAIKDERAAKKGLPDGDDLLADLDDSPV